MGKSHRSSKSTRTNSYVKKKKCKNFDIALGLNGGEFYGQLDDFANVIRKEHAKRKVFIDSDFSAIVGERITTAITFKKLLPKVLSKCNEIHFNMHNFDMKVYKKSFRENRVSRRTMGDVTNYELY